LGLFIFWVDLVVLLYTTCVLKGILHSFYKILILKKKKKKKKKKNKKKKKKNSCKYKGKSEVVHKKKKKKKKKKKRRRRRRRKKIVINLQEKEKLSIQNKFLCRFPTVSEILMPVSLQIC
jgi:hypothetical protein